MEKVKYLILGGGPAGLALGAALKKNGQESFLILEQEAQAGGLCKSQLVDGSELDISGGHFLDVRNQKVVDFIFEYMPREEWNFYTRDSRIYIHDTYIGHPFEANIWQFDTEIQNRYLDSIKCAGCNSKEPMPERFTDWIYWKFGKEIADNYMLPYNKKMFGDNLDKLGTYWLEKLPDVSYEETMISCKEHKPYGKQPGHVKFYYPKKYGFGEPFRRIANSLHDNIIYNSKITSLDVKEHIVNEKFRAEVIINTVPWTSINDICGISDRVKTIISELAHTSIYVDYYNKTIDNEAQWIYYPDESKSYHRILVRHNFLDKSKGYWTETNSDRIDKNAEKSMFSYMTEYAYPLNTVGKNENMTFLLNEMSLNGVIGIGRWGEWQHYNMDAVIDRSLNLANQLNK